jgi:hypothetical protein
MSETTPSWWNGPWKAVETRVYFPKAIGGFDVRGCPDPEMLAAFLASAPDLYAALADYMAAVERMQGAMRDGCNVHGALSEFSAAEEAARAALAAATKETPDV